MAELLRLQQEKSGSIGGVWGKMEANNHLEPELQSQENFFLKEKNTGIQPIEYPCISYILS